MAPLEEFERASLAEMTEAVSSSVLSFRLSSLQIQISSDRAAADGYGKVPHVA